MVETGEELFGTTYTKETIHTLAQSYYLNIQHITTTAPSQSVNLELFITDESSLDSLWVDCYNYVKWVMSTEQCSGGCVLHLTP